MSDPTPGALSAGQVFHGRYEIVRCLKAGGMGAVYECIHLKTQKHRALKVMLPQMLANTSLRSRFDLEARVTAKIESEHIVETFDAGIDDATGAPFLVMELLRGEDLGSMLSRLGPLPASETILLLTQTALALDKTHAAGIVHRDLKPDNLFVTLRDDGTPRLKILDFGIAKVVADVNHSVEQTAMIGTPLYMSPEQVLGEGTIGPRADVYAMGHIAFALLTGGAYWMDEQKVSPALFVFLGNVMAGALEPPTARAARRGVPLPPAFDAWFARATARSASDRFERASVMVQELAVVLGVSATRVASLPFVDSGSFVPALSLAGPTSVLTAFVPTAEPDGAGAPAVSEGATVATSSKSIASIPTRSRVPLLMAGLAALGLAGIGVLAGMRGSGPAAATSLAPTVVKAASSPPAVTSVPEAAPSVVPATAPEASSSAGVPLVSATAAPAPAPQRPRPAPVKPAAPLKGCDPPYVIDSAGLRVMKPQCL